MGVGRVVGRVLVSVLCRQGEDGGGRGERCPGGQGSRRPEVVASGTGMPLATWLIRAAPTAEKIASPSATPICWEELRMAAATSAATEITARLPTL
jgi:hypothetical protein